MNGSTHEMAWRLTDDGAFVCGDRTTGTTAYAYPTSEHASNAKRHARATAAKMLAGENARAGRSNIKDIHCWDLRHWWIINAGTPIPDYMHGWSYPAHDQIAAIAKATGGEG